MARLGSLLALLLVVACTVVVVNPGPNASRAGTSVPRRVKDATMGTQIIRVAVGTGERSERVSATGAWRFYEANGRSVVARAAAGKSWRIEREGSRVRAVRPDGVPTVWKDAPLIARVTGHGFITLGGKAYRGELLIYPAGDDELLVVNRLQVDEYLKGVVPMEIGERPATDSAAVQAQAVAARSYAVMQLDGDPARKYDVTAGVLDQVYGGVNAERPVSTAAVESTRGLALRYHGRVVNAPYHSTCGGTTAEAPEVWRTAGEPYLQSVSDRIPGTNHYYCELSPRFRWTRELSGETLTRALARYLSIYTEVRGGNPGVPQAVYVQTRTPSGRVGTLSIATDRGNFSLRGNDIRYVLREPGGEILNSTYFSVDVESGSGGAVKNLRIRGAGYGHGIGMCQWGAIGRARAGQDFRTILRTYYPGTTVE